MKVPLMMLKHCYLSLTVIFSLLWVSRFDVFTFSKLLNFDVELLKMILTSSYHQFIHPGCAVQSRAHSVHVVYFRFKIGCYYILFCNTVLLLKKYL